MFNGYAVRKSLEALKADLQFALSGTKKEDEDVKKVLNEAEKALYNCEVQLDEAERLCQEKML